MSLTKIIATLGPASDDDGTVERMIVAGASIFRLNFGHATFDGARAAVERVRRVSDRLERECAVFGDLQGPKIRVGPVESPGVEVETGSTVVFARGSFEARHGQSQPVRLASTYERLVDDVEPGQRLLVNDGAVRMLVVNTTADEIECAVTHGGLITSGKGINLPDTKVSAECLGAPDWSWVRWSIEHDLDYLALSFVRSDDDVTKLRDGIARIADEVGLPSHRVPIIAKIELPAAVEHADAIIAAADAVMIARGDLGVELDLAQVPVVQKRLAKAAHDHGKPCIVATQMLQSMIEAPTPTRAEASDVATAIFDKVDAVMLSGETATGSFPSLAVDHMRRIAEYAEGYLATLPATSKPPSRPRESRHRTAALAHGVWAVAQDTAARLIVVWSQQGGGARYLSQNEFQIPIIAFTSDHRAARQMQLLRGVRPIVAPIPANLAEFTREVDRRLLGLELAETDDPCILVAGEPIGQVGVTNSLAIHRVGSATSGFALHERSRSARG